MKSATYLPPAGALARTAGASAVVLAVVAISMPVTPAWGSAGTGQVYVLQGLPQRTVNLFVGNQQVGANVATKSIVGPLSLSTGSYQLRVTDATSSAMILQRALTVSGGSSVDAVVHLNAEATPAPKLTIFPNDESAVNSGKTRLSVAHTADVPPADIRVDNKVLFSNVANGEGLTTVVPAASYTVDVVPTGTNGPAILGPATFGLKSGTLTRVFAIGRPATHTMDAIVQVLPIATSATGQPGGINTGLGGRAASASGSRSVQWTLVTAGLGLLAFAAAWRRRFTSRRVER